MNSLLQNIGLYLSIVFIALSAIIIIVFNVPLQIREAKVKNGLAKLRIQLLLFGFVLLVTNFVSLFFLAELGIRVFNTMIVVNQHMQILLAIYGASHFALACIGYMIYHQQYTSKQKELHARIEKIEKREERK